MMKRVLLAMAMLVLSAAAPAFAVEGASIDLNALQGMQGDSPLHEGMAAGGPGAQEGMPGCNQMMMQNPEKMLMMAYHQNVVSFGKALEKVARQRDTVPPEFARAALAEMRRSVEQIEKYRAGALAGMPPGMKGGEMQKMMDEHLVNVKTQLRELDELAKSDTISSNEVLKHLDILFHDCNGTSCKPPHLKEMQEGKCHKGMHDGKMSGCMKHDCMKHDCMKHDCMKHGCMKHGCGHEGRHDCGECAEHSGMMPQHHQMMMEMAQKIKAQDAELQKMVDKMQKAPKSKKVDELAAIVAKMVKQRAEMTAQMEKMQNNAMEGEDHHHHPGGPHPPCGCDHKHGADGDGMDMGDMKMQESGE